ncbi:28S ribosomal protein S21, mitochondrial [Bagarius yarrelli]|uniref:28S ribosomal protein S21, mitochondrial n=1 Tax=Bagarius yarrelli TaxID=175774 RepID=A0A556U8K3_BAGYA|nr:28S ribosomal protein S21, mitochondrial [Bagarius yarrelli]
MEVNQKNDSSRTLANGSANSGKRGRGRPRGSFKKKINSVKEVTHNARTSKRVDFFSPEMVIRPKARKRGRPKKIKIPGRPRKIPLTPEEEAERILRLSKKRKFSKPGRPRIHPLINLQKEKRGRGRPRKYEAIASQNCGNMNSVKVTVVGGDPPRGRGRPKGSFKKKRGRPAGSSLGKRLTLGTARRRGRPPGSGTKLQVRQDVNGTPRKRGRPPGSGIKIKIISSETNGTPRKRGRPPGSGAKVKVAKQEVMDGQPRKRGRPPGSGTKAKNLPQETNGSPRKRGRPPGSGKIKTFIVQAEHVLTNSALSVDAQPRKRGRPKKVRALPDVQKQEVKIKENVEPSPKRPRNSFASTKNLSKPDAEDRKARENEGGHVAATVDTPVLCAGGAAKPVSIEPVGDSELNNTSFEVVYESHSKKSSSSRVAGILYVPQRHHSPTQRAFDWELVYIIVFSARAVFLVHQRKMASHLRFVARTVMVQDGNVDAAYKALNRVLSLDGIIETVKRQRFYEKPCRRRQRENYENCKRIYNMEMARKISFVSRTNRQDPWLGC